MHVSGAIVIVDLSLPVQKATLALNELGFPFGLVLFLILSSLNVGRRVLLLCFTAFDRRAAAVPRCQRSRAVIV